MNCNIEYIRVYVLCEYKRTNLCIHDSDCSIFITQTQTMISVVDSGDKFNKILVPTIPIIHDSDDISFYMCVYLYTYIMNTHFFLP
jgi:hypothetical protein